MSTDENHTPLLAWLRGKQHREKALIERGIYTDPVARFRLQRRKHHPFPKGRVVSPGVVAYDGDEVADWIEGLPRQGDPEDQARIAANAAKFGQPGPGRRVGRPTKAFAATADASQLADAE